MHSNIEYAEKYHKGVGVSKKGQKGSVHPKNGQIQGQKGSVHPKRVNSGPVGVGASKTGTCYGQKQSASPKSGQKGTHNIIKGSACPKRGKTGRKGSMRPKKG